MINVIAGTGIAQRRDVSSLRAANRATAINKLLFTFSAFADKDCRDYPLRRNPGNLCNLTEIAVKTSCRQRSKTGERTKTTLEMLSPTGERTKTTLEMLSPTGERTKTGMEMLSPTGERTKSGMEMLSPTGERTKSGVEPRSPVGERTKTALLRNFFINKININLIFKYQRVWK
jgi:hypothetical protein